MSASIPRLHCLTVSISEQSNQRPRPWTSPLFVMIFFILFCVHLWHIISTPGLAMSACIPEDDCLGGSPSNIASSAPNIRSSTLLCPLVTRAKVSPAKMAMTGSPRIIGGRPPCMFDSLAALETSALRDVVFAVLDMARWCSWVQGSSERGEIRHQVASVCARVELAVPDLGDILCVCRMKHSRRLKRTTVWEPFCLQPEHARPIRYNGDLFIRALLWQPIGIISARMGLPDSLLNFHTGSVVSRTGYLRVRR